MDKHFRWLDIFFLFVIAALLGALLGTQDNIKYLQKKIQTQAAQLEDQDKYFADLEVRLKEDNSKIEFEINKLIFKTEILERNIKSTMLNNAKSTLLYQIGMAALQDRVSALDRKVADLFRWNTFLDIKESQLEYILKNKEKKNESGGCKKSSGGCDCTVQRYKIGQIYRVFRKRYCH